MLILSVFLKKLNVFLLKIIVHKQKNIDHIFLVVLLTKVVCIDNKFSKKVVLYIGKMPFTHLLKQFLVNTVIVRGGGWG